MTPFVEITSRSLTSDVVSRKLASQIRDQLHLDPGEVRRSLVLSFAFDLTAEQLAQFANACLGNEIIEETFINCFASDPQTGSWIRVSKWPGVTDDQGISAQNALADYFHQPTWAAPPHPGQVFTHWLYRFSAKLSLKEQQIIAQEILGNPLVNQFFFGAEALRLPDWPEAKSRAPEQKEALAIDIFVDEASLLELSQSRLLALDLNELHALQNYYLSPKTRQARKQAGLPLTCTDLELEIIAQTWSEHCKHKEFNARIEYHDLRTGEAKVIDSLFQTYIVAATAKVSQQLCAAGKNWLLKVFNDNAGVVRIDEQRLFVWKVETHNSPSALDPYGGALTGILGNNRDPLGTGRGGAKLLFNTDVLCFAPPDYDKPLLPGQLPPRRILLGVRQGIEDGGNKSGVPTVGGAVIFDERYAAKPLVFCGTGGLLPAQYGNLNTWEKDAAGGDLIVMVGGRVGKDGIHGATFSSLEIDENSPRSAVQIGSPFTQKMLRDFLEAACAQGLVRCLTDNGAGGLSSSIGELASLTGGARVDLEKVPLKYPDLQPWEIFLSESQERMTLIVTADSISSLMHLASHYEVLATVIGECTTSGHLEVLYEGHLLASLDLDFLHHGVPQKSLSAQWTSPPVTEPIIPTSIDYQKMLLDLLRSPNICSRETLIRQYDHEVLGKTVIKPLMGMRQAAPQDAAVLRWDHDSFGGYAVSVGICPRYGDLDPYQMSAGAFDEAVRQIIAVGGELPLHTPGKNLFWSVNDNFCLPDCFFEAEKNPDGKFKLAQLVRMCEGLYDIATAYCIPLTSGKDSMKNDFRSGKDKLCVPPTVLYSMVAQLEDVRCVQSAEFKAADDFIYCLGETYEELGRSEFFRLLGEAGGQVPMVRPREAVNLYHLVSQAHRRGLLASCHDLSDGGLAVALAESAFGGVGCKVQIPENDLSLAAHLFSESHSRFLVSVAPEARADFLELFDSAAHFLGTATADDRTVINFAGKTVIDLPIKKLREAWQTGGEIFS